MRARMPVLGVMLRSLYVFMNTNTCQAIVKVIEETAFMLHRGFAQTGVLKASKPEF